MKPMIYTLPPGCNPHFVKPRVKQSKAKAVKLPKILKGRVK